jgi:lipoate-protein ligase A
MGDVTDEPPTVLDVCWGREGRASDDLAFEGRMLERAAEGRPSIFVYSWPRPVVVLGYAQDPGDVDLGWCREHSIPVLRRMTGGTGVLQCGDLSVSLALPGRHPWARGVLGLYDRFLDALGPSLVAAGSRVLRDPSPRRASRVRSPVCFFDRLSDTLLVDGAKAVGCAQTRRGGAVLIHAVVLLGLDAALYARVFRMEESAIRRALAPALPGAGWREVAAPVVSGLAAALGLEATRRAVPVVAHLEGARYADPRWAPVPEEPVSK